MIRDLLTLIFVISASFLVFSCGNNQTQQGKPIDEEPADPFVEEKISLSEVISPEFPDAGLELNVPLEGDIYNSGDVSFDFNIKNYQLGTQTLDADMKQCANSGKGQHIHLILNGEPYRALYEPNYATTLEPGHYVSLAFLSRSYHESLKHYGASVITQFTVGDVQPQPVDLTAPHMFYSRPKGDYTGADTENVILDFYLVNTDLSPDGNKVRATINNEQFLIEKWSPHFIHGLPMGENTIKLELVDQNGEVIDGPYNTVERKIMLTEDPT